MSTPGRVHSLCRGVGGLALVAVLASCSRSSGNVETDRIATVVGTAISFADVGVSLWAPDTRDCLLGARIGGQVTVWWPPQPNPQLGNELSPCDPQTALQLLGVGQPH